MTASRTMRAVKGGLALIGAMVGLGVVLTPAPASAAPVALACPGGAQQEAKGWTKPADAASSWSNEGWALFDGPPEGMAQLAPERDNGRRQLYLLPSDSEAYLRCRFGSDEIWETKLPSGLQSCEVTYAPGSRQRDFPRFDRVMTCK